MAEIMKSGDRLLIRRALVEQVLKYEKRIAEGEEILEEGLSNTDLKAALEEAIQDDIESSKNYARLADLIMNV